VLLLEFLEGPTLARVIDSAAGRRLGLSDALRLAIHVGSALHHMHRQGLIHLDLSPSNIIVTSGRPVLIDFGTARRLSEPRPGDVVGTDAYIAPEECRLETLTPAADVFGLAVLLYELLCGRRPFPRGSRRQPFPQVEGRPSPLSRYRNGLPNELERLLRACLAPDPLARPALPDLLVALNGMIRGGRRMWPAGFDPTVGSAATRVSKRGASQPPFPGLACEFDSSREFPA
jgi:serine/threonine protein kinase